MPAAKQPASSAASKPAVVPAKRKARAGSKPERSQLTPQDWIRAATELLIHRSIEAVRVDVLAKTMAVTRGSFYWHFSDRDDLLKRVLLGWQEEQTEQIIARYRNGVPDEEIMGHTRHRSLTTMRSYVRRAKLSRTSPAGKLGL